MTKRDQTYKCLVCGNMVEVIHASGGTLVCCGRPMQIMEENTVDAALEKHLPVIEKTEEGVLVKIGAVIHPMTEEHYIEWIEVYADNQIYRKYLKPGEKPEAYFEVKGEIEYAKEYCNLHGVWKK